MKTEFTTAQMLADLTVTFPKLWKRPLREFGAEYLGVEGVWTGADGPHVMPDGDEIFITMFYDLEPPYTTGPVHDGFIAWLQNRGWTWDQYDGATFFLVPNSHFDEADE